MNVLRLALAAGCAAATLAAPAADALTGGTAGPTQGPLLGIDWQRPHRDHLARFDPLTLRRLPGPTVPLGKHTWTWSFSPDRTLVAFGGNDAPEIRIVDVRSMRLRGDLRLARTGSVVRVAWQSRDRLLALVDGSVVRDRVATTVVVADPLRRSVLAEVALPGPAWDAAATADGLAVLVGADNRIRSARIAHVDRNGKLRTAALARIRIGFVVYDSVLHRTRRFQPALAVDREAGRAYVVGAERAAATINVKTMRVSYHPVGGSGLGVRATTKSTDGHERTAQYLGEGVLAVSGVDNRSSIDANGDLQWHARAAGLRLLDTRTWRSRLLNADASSFEAGAGLVFALGGSWDSETQTQESVGVVAYGRDGRERYRLYEGEPAWVRPAHSLGYAYGRDPRRYSVVDLRSGKVVGRLTRPRGVPFPALLVGRDGA